MKLAIVLVHYHTPWLVGPAVTALRSELASIKESHELLLVDNGSQAGDRETFESLGLKVLDPGSNHGFAAGFNRGVEATAAEVLVVMNPDVLVRPGCLGHLLGTLDAGAAAAGPLFSWDESGDLWLPPAEPRTRRWELRAALAGRGASWSRRARRSWRRHAWSHWSAKEPIESYSLSGALLAIRREAWNEIGPFDDGFRLYFEETDWLHRLRRAKLPAMFVPAARARHRYNLSAVHEPRSAQWFENSCRRFRRRHYGAAFTALLETVERGTGFPSSTADPAAESPPEIELPPDSAWIELSPQATGFPAAGQRLQKRNPSKGFCASWVLPAEVWRDLAPGTYALRTVSAEGRELGRHAFRRPAATER